mgnify:CR=1 FL=1
MKSIEILFKTRLINEFNWSGVKSNPEFVTYIYDSYRYTIEFRFGEVILHAKGVEHKINDISDHDFNSEEIYKTTKFIHDKFIEISCGI